MIGQIVDMIASIIMTQVILGASVFIMMGLISVSLLIPVIFGGKNE